MTDGDLDILLVEDNPGDARLIEEMLPRADSLLHHVDTGVVGDAGTIELRHEERLADALSAIAADRPDVVLLDLGLPDSNGLDTLTAVLSETSFIPVVVLTGLSDEGVGIEAIQHGAQEYLVKDEVSEDLLVRGLYHAIERNRQEREREHRRNQLEALNRLNRIGHDVTHAVIMTDTREELEQAVCDRLIDSDRYAFAWIGELDRRTDRVTPRVSVGNGDGYLDDVMGADVDGTRPPERTVRSHEPEVMRNITADTGASWQAAAVEREFQGVVSVPILYEDFLYGVLTIYATRPGSFSEPAVDILSRLGDVIAHAITALERKDALQNETVLQLEFKVDGLLTDVVALTTETAGRVHFENMIVGDRMIAYGRAEDLPPDEFVECMDAAAPVDSVRLLVENDEWCKFEVVTDAVQALTDAVTDHGGTIRSAMIADGDFRFTLEFPTGRDKRRLIELVEEHCSGAVHHAQRTVERELDEVAAAQGALNGELTEKQRLALRSAYYAGFFEWPRESSGQDIADRMGIAPATFSQHIRSAEQKVFQAIFNGDRAPQDSEVVPEST